MAEHAITVQGGRVVIRLDQEAAEWLASDLPGRDGFTIELWRAIERLEAER